MLTCLLPSDDYETLEGWEFVFIILITVYLRSINVWEGWVVRGWVFSWKYFKFCHGNRELIDLNNEQKRSQYIQTVIFVSQSTYFRTVSGVWKSLKPDQNSWSSTWKGRGYILPQGWCPEREATWPQGISHCARRSEKPVQCKRK